MFSSESFYEKCCNFQNELDEENKKHEQKISKIREDIIKNKRLRIELEIRKEFYTHINDLILKYPQISEHINKYKKMINKCSITEQSLHDIIDPHNLFKLIISDTNLLHDEYVLRYKIDLFLTSNIVTYMFEEDYNHLRYLQAYYFGF